jgi:hypothetical protein
MNDIYDRVERRDSSCIIESMRKVALRRDAMLPTARLGIYSQMRYMIFTKCIATHVGA